jgi:hypothetical protein
VQKGARQKSCLVFLSDFSLPPVWTHTFWSQTARYNGIGLKIGACKRREEGRDPEAKSDNTTYEIVLKKHLKLL